MKMAKASKADLDTAFELVAALAALNDQWTPIMPAALNSQGEDGQDEFDIDNHDHCRKALQYLLELDDYSAVTRVVMGCAILLDPRNNIVDPDQDVLELHPDILRMMDAATARPAAEWTEDMGDVLWWKFPIEEPPYIGCPTKYNWPNYHTHFTPLLVPTDPTAEAGA